MDVRGASAADAEAIATIYNHYVRTSVATFDEVEKTPHDRRAWIDEHGEAYPVFVAEEDGRVVGWAALSKWRERSAYRRTVEMAVYVEPAELGRGIGAALLDAVLAAATYRKYHAVIAQITEDNEASIRAAERAGFRRVGVLREVGYKFDRWIDVVLMQYMTDEKEWVE